MALKIRNLAFAIFLVSALVHVQYAFAQSAPEDAIDASSSTNWAGYAVKGKNVTSVSGSWIVPTSEESYSGSDATWIGIGGISSRDLIQIGTQSVVEDGEVRYLAWIERLPQALKRIPLTVSGGDSVSASVTEIAPDKWHMHMTNNTTGKSFDADVSYPSSKSSAEWIQELPTGIGFRIRLSRFGVAQFTEAAATIDGKYETISNLDARAIDMVSRAGVIAETSVLSGDSFSVSRRIPPRQVVRNVEQERPAFWWSPVYILGS